MENGTRTVSARQSFTVTLLIVRDGGVVATVDAVIVACAVSASPQSSVAIRVTVYVPATLIARPIVESDILSVPGPATVNCSGRPSGLEMENGTRTVSGRHRAVVTLFIVITGGLLATALTVMVACAVSAAPQLSAATSFTVQVPAALIARQIVESEIRIVPSPITDNSSGCPAGL